MIFQWLDDWIGIRKSTTRIPFRYGTACLVRCPQLLAEVTLEVDGRRATGWSGDCLPPSWFDKTPAKEYPQQLEEMVAVIERFREEFRGALRNGGEFFPTWLDLQRSIPARATEWGYVPLLLSFGLSIWERAVIDAACRACQVPFAQAVRDNLWEIDAGAAHKELAGWQPSDWLPEQPLQRVSVRHTVGMGDPLTATDVAAADRLHDSRPQTLEEYVRDAGVRYFKIKVTSDVQHDRDRLEAVASIIEQYRDGDYYATVDGNEQFSSVEAFATWFQELRKTPPLQRLWANTVAIEQPLSRAIALRDSIDSLHEILGNIPVIIDESDGELDSYVRAVELGYGGVSSKNCKGAHRSLLNAGLASYYNRTTESPVRQVMTGEDLCSVGVVPVQSDLCLAATLGLQHVERNGHHFHPGLSYLPPSSQDRALAAHPDFYERLPDAVSPRLRNGGFEIASLQCVGFGFQWRPDRQDWPAPADWSWQELIGPSSDSTEK